MPNRKRSTRRRSQNTNADLRALKLDLEPSIFTLNDPRRLAQTLKRVADRSWRRKTTAYKSAMSTLRVYIDSSRESLSPRRRERLEAAKDELRVAYNRPRRYVKKRRPERRKV